MRLLWALLLILGGCGSEPHIAAELKPLLDHYLEFAKASGDLDKLESLQFGSILNQGERGVCKIEKQKVAGKPYDETRKIVIDPAGEFGVPIAITVFHELGHCLTNLPHSSGLYDIMNPMRGGDGDYWTPEHIDQALKEMFQ